MWVKCGECGFHGEINGQHFATRKIRCKCGVGLLERTIPLPNHFNTAVVVAAAKSEIDTSGMSGREEVGEYIKQGKGLQEVIKLMEQRLVATTVRSYYCYAVKEVERTEGRRRGGAPLGNKNAKRKKLGEDRNCVDCGKEIYITPYRIKHPKSENEGKRCRPCALKWVRDTRKPRKHRMMRRTIVRHIEELQKKFLSGELSEYKAGAVYACNLIIEFVECKNGNSGQRIQSIVSRSRGTSGT